MAVLGVDPGSREGAAVLVEGERVLAWWAWSLMRRTGGDVYRLRWSRVEVHDGVCIGQDCDDLGAVGWVIRQALRPRSGDPIEVALVVEGLFVPRAGQGINLQTHTALAESAGWLMGGLGLGLPVARPLASTWRPAVLCPARTPADAAERLAVQATRWADWPGDPVARLTPKELGAVAEAGFMCDWWLTCGKAAR